MSSRIGTLQAPRSGQFMLPALLALLFVATFATVVVSIDRDQGRQDAVTVAPQTRHVNTPTELSGGLSVTSIGGTLANTPTEIRGGYTQATVTFESTPGSAGRRGVTPRVSASDQPTVSHRPIDVNGTLCGQCA